MALAQACGLLRHRRDTHCRLLRLPTGRPPRFLRSVQVPTSIASMAQLSKAWRQGVLCCHPDKQGVDASVVTKHLAERVFDTVKVKYEQTKTNLQQTNS